MSAGQLPQGIAEVVPGLAKFYDEETTNEEAFATLYDGLQGLDLDAPENGFANSEQTTDKMVLKYWDRRVDTGRGNGQLALFDIIYKNCTLEGIAKAMHDEARAQNEVIEEVSEDVVVLRSNPPGVPTCWTSSRESLMRFTTERKFDESGNLVEFRDSQVSCKHVDVPEPSSMCCLCGAVRLIMVKVCVYSVDPSSPEDVHLIENTYTDFFYNECDWACLGCMMGMLLTMIIDMLAGMYQEASKKLKADAAARGEKAAEGT